MQTFSGVITALVTPLRDDKVDEEALRRLVDEQIAGGVDGLVPVGTTGESPTLTVEARDLHSVRAAVGWLDGVRFVPLVRLGAQGP